MSLRGDNWVTSECPGCTERQSHIDQLEEALAAARASMILARAELDALLVRYCLTVGRGRGEA
jgi:hypothetical protein